MNEKLSLTQLDLLREIGTVGAGTSATALAELIGEKVEISVPQVSLIPLENISNLLGEVERLFFVLDMEIRGEISGRIFLLFPPEHAKLLSSSLLSKPQDQLEINDEMFQSSLKECANILCGSYVTALADMTNLNVITTVPSLAIDMVGAILDFIFIQIAQYSEKALFIKTDLKVKGLNLEGLFLFFPFSESLTRIFEALGIKE